MVGTLLVGIYIFFCLTKDKYWILNSFIILFPCHITIKQLLLHYFDNIGLFTIWYDVALLLLLVKTLIGKHEKKLNGLLYVAILFIFITYYFLTYLFEGQLDAEAISTFRIYFHCIILYIIGSIIIIDEKHLGGIYKSFINTCLLLTITGLIIYLLFQSNWHYLMDHYIINDYGLETYITSSFLIMGVERMFGLLPGPNQFGVLIALFMIILFFIKIQKYKVKKSILLISLILSIVCIVLSFSRAGWGIFIISLFMYNWVNHNYMKLLKFVVAFLFFLSILLILMNYFYPNYFEIIISSIDGSEASVSVRGDNITYISKYILNEPLGHGLGSGILENGTPIAESSLMILLYEIGIIGGFYYEFLILLLGIIILRINTSYSKYVFAIIIATIIISIFSMNVFQYPYVYYLWLIIGLSLNKSVIVLTKKYATT